MLALLMALPLVARGERGAVLVKDAGPGGSVCTAVRILETPGAVTLPLDLPTASPGLYRLALPLRFHPHADFDAARLILQATVTASGGGLLAFPVALAQLDGTPGSWTLLERDVSLPRAASGWRLTLAWSFGDIPEGSGMTESPFHDPPPATPAMHEAMQPPAASDALLDSLIEEVAAETPRALSEIDYPAMLTGRATLEPITTSLAVEKVWPSKVHVYPGEKNPIAVTVRHYGEKPVEARLQAAMHRGLDDIEPLGERRLTVPAGGTATVEFDWTADQREYGHAAVAVVSAEGYGAHTNREYFSVGDPIWKTAIQGNGFIFWHGREHLFESHVENNRRAYINVEEAFSWAPCSWTDLNPTNAIWRTGQNDYRNSLAGLQEWLARSRRHGIKMITYSWAAVNGRPGYDFARRFPDLLARYNGGVSPPDTEDLALQKIIDDRPELWRHRSGRWMMHYVNLGLLRTMDIHAREVIRSAKAFGWDGLRFDYPPAWSGMGSDGVLYEIEAMGATDTMRELMPEQMRRSDGEWSDADISIRNVRYFRHAMREALGPRFALSYNSGSGEPSPDDRRWWFDELCRDGGQIMNEVTRRPGSMRRYADMVWWHAEAVRQAGGHSCVFPSETVAGPLTSVYSVIFTFASGTHPYLDYGWLNPMPGAYTAFATRFGEFLWDLDLAPVTAADSGLTVAAPQPLLWERYIRRRERDGRRLTLVHLINMHDGDPDKAVVLPQAEWQRGVTVSLTGARAPSAWLLTAEPVPSAVSLDVVQRGDAYVVTVPEVRFWSMVVWEDAR